MGARLNWQRSASEPLGMVTDTAANTQEKNQTAQYRPSLYWAPEEEKKSVRPSTGLLCALHVPCSLENAYPARQHSALPRPEPCSCVLRLTSVEIKHTWASRYCGMLQGLSWQNYYSLQSQEQSGTLGWLKACREGHAMPKS